MQSECQFVWIEVLLCIGITGQLVGEGGDIPVGREHVLGHGCCVVVERGRHLLVVGGGALIGLWEIGRLLWLVDEIEGMWLRGGGL